MIFVEAALSGVFRVTIEPREDERGFFARAWCRQEFSRAGLDAGLEQINQAWNRERGTLRGLHYQVPPHSEAKLVRVMRGAIYDIVVDVRRESSTYRQWLGMELTAVGRQMLYVPHGFAHGYLTLQDDTEVLYQVSHRYAPHAERGIRYDDPSLAITLPAEVRVVSVKDRTWPLLDSPAA